MHIFILIFFKRRRGCPPIWIRGFSSPYRTHRSDRLHGRPAPALPPRASTHGSLGVSEHKRSNQQRRPPDLWWTPHGSRPSLRTCRWKHVSASSETILLLQQQISSSTFYLYWTVAVKRHKIQPCICKLQAFIFFHQLINFSRWQHRLCVETYLRNWDLAVPGSPHSSALMSPRTLCFPPGKERIEKKGRVKGRTNWSTVILSNSEMRGFTWIFGLPSKQRQGERSLDVLMPVDRWRHAGKDLQTVKRSYQNICTAVVGPVQFCYHSQFIMFLIIIEQLAGETDNTSHSGHTPKNN